MPSTPGLAGIPSSSPGRFGCGPAVVTHRPVLPWGLVFDRLLLVQRSPGVLCLFGRRGLAGGDLGDRDSVLLGFYCRQRSDAREDGFRISSGAQSIWPVYAGTGCPSGSSYKTNGASFCDGFLDSLGRHFIGVRTGPNKHHGRALFLGPRLLVADSVAVSHRDIPGTPWLLLHGMGLAKARASTIRLHEPAYSEYPEVYHVEALLEIRLGLEPHTYTILAQ